MRSRSSYPPPPCTIPWSSEKRPLIPIIDPPPSSTPLPQIPPKRSNPSALGEWYTLTTHVVPAAFPRTTPDIDWPAGSNFVPVSETKQEKRARIQALRDAYFNPKESHWAGHLTGQSEKRLWCCVDRFVRRDVTVRPGSKRLTLFLAHGIGFPKEVSGFWARLVTLALMHT
jgi:hypothetical protein